MYELDTSFSAPPALRMYICLRDESIRDDEYRGVRPGLLECDLKAREGVEKL